MGSRGLVAVGAALRPLAEALTLEEYDVVSFDTLAAVVSHPSTVPVGRLIVMPTTWIAPDLDKLEELRGRTGTHLVVVDDDPTPARAASWLDAGADDYLAREIGRHEVLARLHAVLRRSPWSPRGGHTLRCGPLSMDVEGRSVRAGLVCLSLTHTEFELMRLLMSAEEPVSAGALAVELWPGGPVEHAPEVKTFVYRLRQHLLRTGVVGVSLRMVAGQGYRLVCDEPSVTRPPVS